MPINPLTLPDPIRYSEIDWSPIDWSPLVRMGKVFAKYREKAGIPDPEAATGAVGNVTNYLFGVD
jgi:hypothetical protein